jgi:drug/metabolite transporter (DMT)-like permease
LFVTFLWSTSWVLIKIGLKELPALTFAGLRYSLAFACLLPFVLRGAPRDELRRLTPRDWLSLSALGVVYYAATQGAQFLGLFYLPAATVSLFLNFTSLAVAGLGLVFLGEAPTRLQWAGMALFLAGLVFYFYPLALEPGQMMGVWVMLGGVAANALSAVMGRAINRAGRLSPLVVTAPGMGIGGLLLLGIGLLLQPMPQLSWQGWLILLWLAVVNTALAFTLWNRTLRSLSAVESSNINSTMLVQIALLAWLFLGETLSGRQIAGIVLVSLGSLAVQARRGG